MTTINFSSIAGGKFTFTGYTMAIYSSQPAEVTLPFAGVTRVTLTNIKTGASISEQRETHESAGAHKATYEISRMLQVVSNVDDLLNGVTYDGNPVCVAGFARIDVHYKQGGDADWQAGCNTPAELLYAAYGWRDKRDADAGSLRLFVNYPQTIQIDAADLQSILQVGRQAYTISPADEENELAFEVSPIGLLCNEGMMSLQEAVSTLQNYPVIVKDVDVHFAFGELRPATNKRKALKVTLDTTENDGSRVYLRWLRRDGSVGYWLFGKSKEVIAASAGVEYTQHLAGVRAGFVDGQVRNPVCRDYNRAETWTIGAQGLTPAEYDYVLDLVASPIVDMCVSRGNDVAKWVRVNVVAGSYTRDVPKSALQRLQSFEMAITLPADETIKL